mgnify:CR=1 FL=1
MVMESNGKGQGMRAGAARVEITPETNIHLSGAVSEFRPAQLIVDPLYAKALVLECGGNRICLVTLDLTIITEEWTQRIREAAARELGVAPDAVMVHATQTHSAPSLGHFMMDPDFPPVPEELVWLQGGDPRYFEFAFDRIVEAIRRAGAVLEPVQMRAGTGIEGRLAFNRRAVMNTGRVFMPGPRWPEPLGPTRLRYLEGPIDPEVGVLWLQNERLRPVAMLLHYTCHPVNVFPKPHVSADWPGAWADEMQQRASGDGVPMILNGCCGNINPWDPFDPKYTPDHRRMGRVLAETTENVLHASSCESDSTLAWKTEQVKLPIREVEPELLEQARATLAAQPNPPPMDETHRRVDGNWVQSASVMSVQLHRQRAPRLDYEIQVFRIGSTAIVGLPGEPFVEGQLRIKMASPAARTFVAHCTTHYVGYVPTREAFDRGGHEVETRYWSKLTPDALDIVVAEASRMLHDVFSA